MPVAKLLHQLSRRAVAARGAVALVAASAFVVAPASAATRTATSPVTGYDATLSGTQLTVTPGERYSRAFLNTVQGRPVTVACVTGAEDLAGIVEEDSLVPTANFDVAFLGGPASWPVGGTSFTYTLARDVSERVDGCLVGRKPAAASTFGFDELGRAVLGESLAEQRLLLAHEAAKQIARARSDRRFPAPRQLAAAIAASEPQLEVAFAPDVRRARRNDVVYVIGKGTSVKRVFLAHRQDDGQPVELRGRRRGDAELKSAGEGEEILGNAPDEVVGRRRPATR